MSLIEFVNVFEIEKMGYFWNPWVLRKSLPYFFVLWFWGEGENGGKEEDRANYLQEYCKWLRLR